MQSRVHISEDNAQFLQVFAHLVINRFALVLSCYASEEFALGLWDTQAIKCVFNLDRNFFPGLALLLDWLNVVIDIVEVNARQISAPGWHWTFHKMFQALEAELPHPTGFALHFGDLFNDLTVKSFLGLECIVFGYMESSAICLFHSVCLTHKIHSICWLLSCNIRRQKAEAFC